MTYQELYTQWVAVNQEINAGSLHETAADDILQDMIAAYCEQHNLDFDYDYLDAIVEETA